MYLLEKKETKYSMQLIFQCVWLYIIYRMFYMRKVLAPTKMLWNWISNKFSWQFFEENIPFLQRNPFLTWFQKS